MFIAAGIGGDRNRRVGPSWRAKLLGGKSAPQLMAEISNNIKVVAQIRRDEGSVLARQVVASGMSRNRWVKRAIAHYLVHECGVDRRSIPHMASDLP